MIIASMIFIIGGLFFITISGIGLIRFPDFYSRTHAIGKSETLGAMLLLFGLAMYNGIQLSSLKLIVILLFIAIANPTATHIIARAAYFCNLEPWIKKKKIKPEEVR